ncbi:MAG TPA: M67 family metallopeptidase [Chloroflexia bacterium]|jgi:proteasome lid subunit RPN8/RPN11|nr:M67 family metallopeptidase [Chloroflexia bacterium]
MTLYLDDCARDSIVQHGEGGYPNEVCGILLGKDIGERRVIRLTMPIENSFEQDEQYHRFLITPADMFRAERLARHDRLDVLGVYHSHPNAPAQPSEYDRDHAAWTTWSYVIVSVRDGKAAEIRAWKLRDDRSAYDEEEVEVSVTSAT